MVGEYTPERLREWAEICRAKLAGWDIDKSILTDQVSGWFGVLAFADAWESDRQLLEEAKEALRDLCALVTDGFGDHESGELLVAQKTLAKLEDKK